LDSQAVDGKEEHQKRDNYLILWVCRRILLVRLRRLLGVADNFVWVLQAGD